MLGETPACSLCSSESANKASIAKSDILFLGDSCLSNYLATISYPHTLISLSQSFPHSAATQGLTASDKHFKSDFSLIASYNLLQLSSSSNKLSEALNEGRKKSIVYRDEFDRNLYRYDIATSKAEMLEVKLNERGLLDASTCQLPGGEILLTAFDESGEPLFNLYAASHKRFLKLVKSIIEKSPHVLCYHQNYVYAFGIPLENDDITQVERYDIHRNRWEMLENIKYKRKYLSPVVVNNKIYLFHGSSSNIEVLNTSTLKYDEVKFNNSEKGKCPGIACRVKDRLYLLTENYIQIYDYNLIKLQEYSYNIQMPRASISNIIIDSDTIYYHNYKLGWLQKLNTSLLPNKRKHRSLEHYARNFNTRYIYQPLQGYSQLFQYDLKHKLIHCIDISHNLSDEFNYSNLVELPSGLLFIINEDKCYLLNPSSLNLQVIPGMIKPRQGVGLVYYNNYIYAFGGEYKFTHTVERFSLDNKSWNLLPDMNQSRAFPSCVAVENRIYIIGGGAEAIEIYDIEKNSYTVSNVVLSYPDAIGMKVDENIYIASIYRYMILNKDGEIVEEGELKYSYYTLFTDSSMVRRNEVIYFYNTDNYRIYCWNIIKKEMEVGCFNEY